MHILRVTEARPGEKSTEYSVRTVSLCLTTSPPVHSVLCQAATAFLARMQSGLSVEAGTVQTSAEDLGVVISEKDIIECLHNLSLLLKCAKEPTIAALQERTLLRSRGSSH